MIRKVALAGLLLAWSVQAKADITIQNGGPSAVDDFEMQVLYPGRSIPKSTPWGDGTLEPGATWKWKGTDIIKDGKLTLKGVKLVKDGDELYAGSNFILSYCWTKGGDCVGNSAIFASLLGGDIPGDEITNYGLVFVPELSTWAYMILGFGAVGFAARRYRAKSVRYST